MKKAKAIIRPQYLLKDYTSINPNFSAERKIIPPGFQELHTHNYFEIELIIKGRGLQVLNGVPYEIKKGNFTFLTTTDFHEHTFKDNTEIINISFDPSVLPQNILNSFINNDTNQTYYLSKTEYNTFYTLMTTFVKRVRWCSFVARFFYTQLAQLYRHIFPTKI